MVQVGTASSFSPTYPVFLVGIFVCGFSSLGYGTVMYVWMMEHVGGKYKVKIGEATTTLFWHKMFSDGKSPDPIFTREHFTKHSPTV